MAASVVLVEATPRPAAGGPAVTVRLAGGGAVVPYRYGGEHWRGGIAGLPRSTGSLDFDGEQLGGGGVASAMELRWSPATAAALAEIAGLYWSDAPITVRVGPEGDALPPIEADGLVLDVKVDGGALVIALADQATDLKRALLVDRYAGTGGIEGPAEFEGAIKPRAWGRCFNLLGRVIDTASDIWCFGDPRRAWQSFDQVRDRGVAPDPAAVTILGWQGSAEATFAALKVAVATDGGCVVCPSIACVKWWTQPTELHADIRGEIEGGYVETAPEIAARIVAARSTLAFAPGAVAAAAAARPAACGWQVDSESATAASELSDLLAGVSLSWVIVGVTIDFRRWEWSASTRTARSDSVTRRQVYKPVTARKLGYRRNWSPMARGDLAAIVLARDVVYEDGQTAEEALADLDRRVERVASDGWLSRGEKPQTRIDYDALTANAGALDARYAALGAPADLTAPRDAAVLAVDTLHSYLAGLGPVPWDDASDDTAIVPDDYRAKWTDAYARVAALAAAITGRPGADGRNGTDGAPGVNGANGQTSYVHFAYADSADGSLGFTADAPGGRAFIGTYSDFTAADSGDYHAYTWSHYTGPASFGLAATGDVAIRGNTIVRLTGEGWDASAYSTEGWRGGVQTSFRLDPGTFGGLNTDPTTDAGYLSIDYSFHCSLDGNTFIIESGTVVLTVGANDTSRLFQIVYDNAFVRYYVNGTMLREIAVAADLLLYFDSCLGYANRPVSAITFNAAGRAGRDGLNGAPGAVGADGRTSYLHVAYANSSNGGIDFTADAPGGRAFIGTYSDFTAADSSDPAAYAWAPYKGPPSFGLVAAGYAEVASNTLVNTQSSDFGQSGGNSAEGWRGGAQTSFRLDPGTFGGLNTDPTTDAGYLSIDYSFHCSLDGNTFIIESGTVVLTIGANDTSRLFQIVYDNRQMVYLIDGNEVRRTAVASGLTLYFDAALSGAAGTKVRDITFSSAGSAGTDGRDGLNGSNGAPGAPGADGRSSYLHVAYANSLDGSVDFTTGAPEGRSYLGVRVDEAVADSGDHAAYTWSLIKGSDGLNGSNGTPGAPGANGQPTYVHIAYANAADGSVDFSVDDPAGRAYVGFYVDQAVADSTNPAAYRWSLVKGADGSPGASARTFDLSTTSLTVAATNAGVTKSGQLPRIVTVTVMDGSTDVTGSTAITLTPSSDSIAAGYAGGAITITQADVTGTIAVAATYAGMGLPTKTISITRVLDAAPPATATSGTLNVDTEVTSTTYDDSAASGALLIGTGGGTSLSASFYCEYDADGSSSGGVKRFFQMAGKAQYRTPGGAWSDMGSEVTGSQARDVGNGEPQSGSITISQSVASLSGNTTYEVRLNFRKTNGTAGSVAFCSGYLVVSQ